MHVHAKLFFAAVLGAGLMASSSKAATVTYTLDLQTPGSFTLTAQASAGDNGGLALYGIPLTGTTLTLNHQSPKADFGSGAGGASAIGFTAFRTADGGGTNQTIVGGQDTINVAPGNLISGFGQEASSFAAKGITPLFGAESETWAVPLVIATGTYTGDLLFNTASVDLVANVFLNTDKTSVIPADVVTNIITGGVAPVAEDLNLLDLDTTVTPIALGTATTSAGDPPITFGGLTFVSYTATNSGVDDGQGGAGAALGSDGAFSFPIDGRARGEYLFSYTATNQFGSDSGNILVEVQNVPEPSTIALMGLAFVGMMGLGRRGR